MSKIRVRVVPIGPEPPRIRSEDDPAMAPPEADLPLSLLSDAEPLAREVVTRRLVLDGQAVRRRREALGWSLWAVARRVRISPAYLCDIELGRRYPSAAVRDRLLTALEW